MKKNIEDGVIDTPKPKVLDIGAIDTIKGSDEGARIELLHPTSGEKTGVFIKVLGKHSTLFRELVRERGNKRVKMESYAARRGKPLEPRTAEQLEADAIELLTACTLGWDCGDESQQVIPFNGEDLPFNVPNVKRVYTERIWVREQIDNAIGDLENFIKA